jgi:hypothetical protein
MPTITIDKKEWMSFLEWKEEKRPSTNRELIDNKRKIAYLLSGDDFGLLKNDFGKSSSIAYVNRLRRVWR